MALQLSLQEEEQRRAAAGQNAPSNEDAELEQQALRLAMEGEKKEEKK